MKPHCQMALCGTPVRRDRERATLPARSDWIGCKQFCTPFAHGNTRIVRALDEQAVGIDELVMVRLGIEQRVLGMRVAMSQNRAGARAEHRVSKCARRMNAAAALPHGQPPTALGNRRSGRLPSTARDDCKSNKRE